MRRTRRCCSSWGSAHSFCCGLTTSAAPWWPRGFRVIRYDNRDVGLSGKTQAQRTQPLWLLMLRAQLGWQTPVPYTLADMAADAAHLLDHLRIPQAHVLGASMGG